MGSVLWCGAGGVPWLGLLPRAALLGDTPTPCPSSSYLAGHPSEISEAEHMGTWSEGEQIFPVPLHLNMLDLGDAPSERELDASRQAGGVGEHATPCF